MRATYGFENPNEAALLLAGATLLLGHAMFSVRPLRWAGWLLAIAGAAAVQPTLSRTAMALLVAGLAVGAWRRRDFSTAERRVGFAVAAAIAATFVLVPSSGERLLESPATDGSTLARVTMWEQIPELLRATPGGWGKDQAGAAYTEWWQALDDTRLYRTLISSHLTIVAESGLIPGVTYVVVWAVGLWSALILLHEGRCVGPSLVVVAYYLAGGFNRVLETPWSRLLVLGCLAAVILAAARTNRRWVRWSAVGCAGGHLIVIAAWIGLAGGSELSVRHGILRFGCGTTRVLVVGTADVLGQRPGRLLRTASPDLRQFTFVLPRDLETTWPACDFVIAGGSVPHLSAYLERHRATVRGVVLFNAEVAALPPDLERRCQRFRGSFTREPDGTPPARVVSGAGRYLPGWPVLAMRSFEARAADRTTKAQRRTSSGEEG